MGPGRHRRRHALGVARFPGRRPRRGRPARQRPSPTTRAGWPTGWHGPTGTPRPPIATTWTGARPVRRGGSFPPPLACAALPPVGRADQAGRRRLAVRAVAALERRAAGAAGPDIYLEELGEGVAGSTTCCSTASCCRRTAPNAGTTSTTPTTCRGRSSFRSAITPSRAAARGDRLQPGLRTAAAAPADHRLRAERTGHRPVLLHAARDDRQRLDRPRPQVAAVRARCAAARGQRRRLPSPDGQRVQAQRARPGHDGGDRRVRSRPCALPRCSPTRPASARNCIHDSTAASPAAASASG